MSLPARRPPRVLALNPGSSSLKTSVLDGEATRVSHTIGAWSGDPPRAELRDLARRHGPLDAVAIRFVHGGDRPGPVLLDDDELAGLDTLVPQAPLHQPRSLALARIVRVVAPGVPVVACFDTSFHIGLPEHAARYALPRPWAGRPELRRAGFHGLSCEYATQRAGELMAGSGPLRLVIAHVGSGVSVSAVDGGRSVDTSMGFTPNDGAVMATRSGSLDPGLVLHLLRTGGLSADRLDAALRERAGLAGLTGGSGDMREVLAARAAGDPEVVTAVEVYLHRLRREIAAAAVSLDAVDALVLTGGVAEGSAWLRSELVAGLGLLGVRLDWCRNEEASDDAVLGASGGGPVVLLVHTREDLQLARGVAELVGTRTTS